MAGFAVFWLLVALVAGVLEACAPSLVCAWFVVGALVTFLVAFAGAGVVVQVVVFLAVSVACLVLLRPLVMRHRDPKASAEPTPVGKRGVVTQAITPDGLQGAVRLDDGLEWTARSEAGQVIAVGTQVLVLRQESVKLYVSPLDGKDG